MRFLGLSLEDWVAILGIISTVVGVIIGAVKIIVHNAYEKENTKNERALDTLVKSVDTLNLTQHNLNETIKELKNDLKTNRDKLNEHDTKIAVLESHLDDK